MLKPGDRAPTDISLLSVASRERGQVNELVVNQNVVIVMMVIAFVRVPNQAVADQDNVGLCFNVGDNNFPDVLTSKIIVCAVSGIRLALRRDDVKFVLKDIGSVRPARRNVVTIFDTHGGISASS